MKINYNRPKKMRLLMNKNNKLFTKTYLFCKKYKNLNNKEV